MSGIDDLLAVTGFETDEHHPHIVIDPVACRTCPSDRACVTSCPAQRYVWDEATQQMSFDHVGCLECGNCRLVCDRLFTGADGYSWNYPVRGAGVDYRQG
ncbi:ferredoxin family protein [Cellulomonas taurus]|uniref:ferredoxin family protein n=1 Tax=Cellulomonas taurus TaxID=2729175 RepID=UPI00145C6951|nr:4Fe-4S ferredoxin [Cellulomonas taurus]